MSPAEPAPLRPKTFRTVHRKLRPNLEERCIGTASSNKPREAVDSSLWSVNAIHTRALSADRCKLKLRGFKKLCPDDLVLAEEGDEQKDLYSHWTKNSPQVKSTQQLYNRFALKAAKVVEAEENRRFEAEKLIRRRKLFEGMYRQNRLTNMKNLGHLIDLQLKESEEKLSQAMVTIWNFERDFMRECSTLATTADPSL